MSLNGAPAGQEDAFRTAVEELNREEGELSRRLGLETVGSAAGWVDLADARRRIPEKSVLVDVVRFTDVLAKGGPADRYAAWVIPPRGSVRVVDLGKAADVDAAVESFRAAMRNAQRPKGEGTITKLGEPDAEAVIRKPLADLAALVLKPLEPHLKGVTGLVVCPDAALWLVPWEALAVGKDEYLIERYAISYVVSGRDLAAPASTATACAPVVFADPDFDGKPVDRTAAGAPPEFRSGSALGSFDPLPGTAAEATALAPNLKKFAGKEPRLLTRGAATEPAFKALQSPKVLVLGTHGYFLKEAKGRDRNPLLRCGLALSGANSRADAGAGQDDGVLTGLEVVGTDLRGTDLVVLSACETGLGDVRSGEGVAGLRQAFQTAGAKGVVASLWLAPDRQTAELMAGFWSHLAAGRGKSDALCAAQLEVIRKRRDNEAAAHPMFWAAFTYTGLRD